MLLVIQGFSSWCRLSVGDATRTAALLSTCVLSESLCDLLACHTLSLCHVLGEESNSSCNMMLVPCAVLASLLASRPEQLHVGLHTSTSYALPRCPSWAAASATWGACCSADCIMHQTQYGALITGSHAFRAWILLCTKHA